MRVYTNSDAALERQRILTDRALERYMSTPNTDETRDQWEYTRRVFYVKNAALRRMYYATVVQPCL